MKNITLIFILLGSILITSCSVSISEEKEPNNEHWVRADYKIIKIDSCEYILFQGKGSTSNIHAIHKQNCKNHEY